MKLSPSPHREVQQRSGQLKLRSLFALLTLIGVFLAWHRQFWQLHEDDKSQPIVTAMAMGLPLAILLSGVWTKLREPLIVVAPVLIIVLCSNCTWTTVYILMQLAHSVPPMTEYSYRCGEILWGSFLWGFGLPASLTVLSAWFELAPGEVKRYRHPLLVCVVSTFNVFLVNFFVIRLFTMKLHYNGEHVNWVRSFFGY